MVYLTRKKLNPGVNFRIKRLGKPVFRAPEIRIVLVPSKSPSHLPPASPRGLLSLRSRKILVLNDQKVLGDLLKIALDSKGTRNSFVIAPTKAEGFLACKDMAPEVILLEPLIEQIAPAQFVREVLQHCPAARLLVYTRSAAPEMAREMMLAGAHGCLTTRHSLADLIEALEMVMRNRLYFEEAGRIHLADAGIPTAPLSERERQVLCLIAEGFSTKEIALRMDVSTKTAGKFRERLMGKLNLHDAVQLTHYAIRHGLVAA